MSRAGALILEGGVTLPDIWVGLHANADMWLRAGSAADGQRQRVRIDESDRALLGALAPVPAETWTSFAQATGWTPYSAIALAWCKGPDLQAVAEHWLAASEPLKVGGHGPRAASLLPPHAAPPKPNLSDIGRAPSIPLVCLWILAAIDPICDVSTGELDAAPAPVMRALVASKVDLPGDVRARWQRGAA